MPCLYINDGALGKLQPDHVPPSAMPLSAASTPPARSGRELSGTFRQPVEVEKINSCGRVALICAFSRGPSDCEVRDWIMRAERRCSRAHRIESSKVARLVWWSSCKKRTNPTFHCCVHDARVSHTTSPVTNKAKNECPRNARHPPALSVRNFVEIGTTDSKKRGKSGQRHAKGAAQINSQTRSGDLELMFPFCDM